MHGVQLIIDNPISNNFLGGPFHHSGVVRGANGGTQFSVNYQFFGQISVNYYLFGQF